MPEKLGKQRSHPAQGSLNIEKHRAEEQTMYKRVFNEFMADGIFPVNTATTDAARKMAHAYAWLGDTMWVYRRFYDFADEQYRRSIALWPSWKNKARRKRTINQIRFAVLPAYRYIRRFLGPVFRYFA